MQKRLLKPVLAALIVALALADRANAAESTQYPVKPIRIVTGEANAAPDIAARIIVSALSESLGQQVIIENRAGAAGAIAAQSVARAAPDGYTLLFYASALWLAPLLEGRKDDPMAPFAPVTVVATSPNILVVHPSVPVKSVNELIALAKSKPGQLNYGSGGVGSSPYLAGELFKAMANVDVVRIGYKGGAGAVNDLVAGRIQMAFASAPSVARFVTDGRLRALAVSSPQPSVIAPNLPTVSASGLPGFETQGVHAMFAPVGTPKSVIDLVQQKVRQVVQADFAKKRFLGIGLEPAGSTAAELDKLLKDEMARWGKLFGKSFAGK